MDDKIDWFFLKTGKKLEDLPKQILSAEQVVKKRLKQLKSNYPLRSLGISTDGELFISEEERDGNFHVIGAPKQGKSKFLEYHIIEDIKLGNGLCLIDPSDGGDTAYNVLNYCASIGYEKVVFIDPRTLAEYGKIAVFNPLNPARIEMSINGLMEALAILFDTDITKTSRIKNYLPALLSALVRTNNTLYETQYFAHFNENQDIRYSILDKLPRTKLNREDFDKATLESVLTKEHIFNSYFASTVFRMNDLRREPLNLMLAANDGIDFVKMVSEGWVILVNLFPGKYMTNSVSQLLGIMIINQIIQAMDILFEAPPARTIKRRFYLYIDEAGSFATPQIEDILIKKRKTGLGLVFAHHFTSQFDNRKVLQAIMSATTVKVMFNAQDHAERLLMAKALGYGGEITPEMAAYANQNIPQQQAVIRKDKESPVRVRIPNVINPPVTKKVLDEYIESLLT